MSQTIVCRRGACPPFTFTTSTPSEYQNPFFRKLDDQRYWLLKLDIHQQKVSGLRATDANVAAEADARTSLDSLRALVSTISRGEVLASTKDFERLLDEAVQHHGVPDDIPDWANRLASEAGKLND